MIKATDISFSQLQSALNSLRSGIPAGQQPKTLTQYSMPMKMTAQINNQTAETAKNNIQSTKSTVSNDLAARLAKIPDLEQYRDVIGRFLSGESEMETMGGPIKPLTEDQIALRKLMREYMSTDTRSMSQIAADMKQASQNSLDAWFSGGNKGPMPGRVLSADGSFKFLYSKAEKNEYMNNQKIDFLRNVMSYLNDGKEIDVKV